MDQLNDIRKQRLEKYQKLIDMGVEPFAYSFDRTDLSGDIIKKFNEKEDTEIEVSCAGRLMALRKMGKAGFAHIMDRQGRIQIYVKSDQTGEDSFAQFKLFDLGDLIGVKGTVFRTRTGEVSILVKHIVLLAKNLRPLPIVKEKVEDDEKVLFDQFSDKETRYRQRYVDLIVNPEVRETFIKRSQVLSEMRSYLEKRGYLEVETPVLQPIYGGAAARPFISHHNTLDMQLYLRISDELYLKRLIVGGFEGVFEIAKNFRNEGMDKDHNPEFTMMELYVVYQDYTFMMDLVEDMISKLAQKVAGSAIVSYQGREIDFSPPWKRISFLGAIEEIVKENLSGKDEKDLRRIAGAHNIDTDGLAGKGKILDELFSKLVEPDLFQPTFVMDYPVELSPLAKKHRNNSDLTERFEAFVACKEICNAFSELNDPIDQRARFEHQGKMRQLGDDEAMMIDEDYLRAMEYGMPPTAGLGIGVDRLVMLLTHSDSIRDVILFPQMRPEQLV